MKAAISVLLLAQTVFAQSGTVARGDALRRREYATTAPVDLYVSTVGNDANNCAAPGAPCLTIQGALNRVPKIIRDAVIINVGAGNFAGAVIDGFTIDTSTYPEVTYLIVRGSMGTAVLASGATTGTGGSSTPGSDSSTVWGTYTFGAAGWTVDDLQGKWIAITAGTGVGQRPRVISSNTATTLTITGAWETPPDATSVFEIQTPMTNIDTTGGPLPGNFDAPTSTTEVAFGISNILSEARRTDVEVGSRIGFESLNITAPVTRQVYILATTSVAVRTVAFSGGGFNFASGSAPFSLTVQDCYSNSGPTGNFLGTSGISATLAVRNNVVVGSNFVWQVAVPATLESTTNLYQGQTTDVFRVLPPGGATLIFTGDVIECGPGASGVRPAPGSLTTSSSFSITAASVSGCTIGLGGRGTSSLNLVGVVGSGNTTAMESLFGTNFRVDATTTLTGATEISIDGAPYTLAEMRSLTPKSVLDLTYGSVVYE